MNECKFMSQLAFDQRFGNAVARTRENTHNQTILGMSGKFTEFWNIGTVHGRLRSQYRFAINNIMWK